VPTIAERLSKLEYQRGCEALMTTGLRRLASMIETSKGTMFLRAFDRARDGAYGRPVQSVEIAQQTHTTITVRWLPPDPNDRSRLIEETNE
jgi:hypothetical protein